MKRILLVVAAAGAITVGSVVPATAVAPPSAYTCTGGHIGSGNYASITVTGFCDVTPYAEISVVGNLTVAAGAVFDAQSVPSTITVGHNVTVAANALLGLGCQPGWYTHNSGHVCGNPDAPEGDPYVDDHSTIVVDGNVTATGADTVLLNGITVKGNVTLTGGGGDIPWSIKNNTIDGNLTVSEVTADWLGVLFNHVGRNVTLTNITATDPGDPGRKVFVVRNTIGWNLTCMGLAPGVSGGFGFGNPSVNVVGRNANGQCAALV